MKHRFFFTSCLLCMSLFMLASCDKENKSTSDQTDAVWEEQPFDTLAAQEGRVWRCERHWTSSSQPQLQGYSVTVTRLDDSCFRSDVFVTEGNFYVRFFGDGVTYRYRLAPTSEGDTLLLALPLDSPEDFDPTSDNAFVYQRVSDTLVRLRCILSLEDEGIEQFDFQRIQI